MLNLLDFRNAGEVGERVYKITIPLNYRNEIMREEWKMKLKPEETETGI